jgi:hypothetical protein
VREIRMLRAMWRALETGLRNLLTGHEGGNAADTDKELTSDHRASARPDRELLVHGEAIARPRRARSVCFAATEFGF